MKKSKEMQVAVVDSANLSEVEVTAELLKTEQFSKEYGHLVSMIDMLSDIKHKVDAGIKAVMKEQYLKDGTNKIESEDYVLTYISGSFKETFNTAEFKKLHPKLYKAFVKHTATAESLRVTKKNKGE